ncbi:probable low affinity copper uptake protein 2 [Scaptodrosophila lebanonensis]|uniref:Copper transport protein n=1 Tax=Drosophila lebanonensis TaxID=7225 RepID=A0A6J2UIP3_DROLE|nr:probable low affinity copper uptake protein 2 [Scaptodrosophila lebanonensis]
MESENDTSLVMGTTRAHGMLMYFHTGIDEVLLWKNWAPTNVCQFVFSTLAFFVLSVFYEWLKMLRVKLVLRDERKKSEYLAQVGSETALVELREQTYWQRIWNSAHFVQALLNILQIAISYAIMLVVMLYNYWLCLGTCLGAATGYFFFGMTKLSKSFDALP